MTSSASSGPAAEPGATTPGTTGAAAAAAVRRAHFPDIMDFYAPGLKRWQTSEWVPLRPRTFLPVSVTGAACALSCDHCQSRVLESMITLRPGTSLVDLARRLHDGGCRGLLVSGGSTRTGVVPLTRWLPDIARIRAELGMTVIVHSGLVTRELARDLAAAGADGVMLDVIGADETFREVYHLDRTVADMDRALAALAASSLRLIPHLVLGLHYGRFVGEYRALELILKYPIDALVLVVLVPLTGTPMAACTPPPVDQITDFFAAARIAAPRVPINLGCARTPGPAKKDLDEAAIDLGLNGIAYPADGVIGYARARGLEPRLSEYCCSLTWAAGASQDAAGLTVVTVPG
ncbi:MAG: radical SAM protein [Streptosporangiaceae bacterium]